MDYFALIFFLRFSTTLCSCKFGEFNPLTGSFGIYGYTLNIINKILKHVFGNLSSSVLIINIIIGIM